MFQIDDELTKIGHQLKKDGVINSYALGGSFAIMHFTDPFETADVDLFVKTKYTQSSIINYMEDKGYSIEVFEKHRYIVVMGIFVHIVPVSDELEKEALEYRAKYGNMNIIMPEYLIAMKLSAWRLKDKLHIAKLLERYKPKMGLLLDILNKFNLKNRWDKLHE